MCVGLKVTLRKLKLIHILIDTFYMKESINRPINGRTFYTHQET